jgi:hypothetical protein
MEWLLPKAEHFPKVYRHTLIQRMMDAALDFQEALFAAQSQRDAERQKHLRQADAALNRLRFYLRLAHRWHWLSNGQYRHVSALIAELGRLLGGWIKSG